MKKALIAAAVIAAVIVALVAGFPTFSRLYYGRSQAATLFAWQFEKDVYTTQEDFEAYLREKQSDNARPYAAPPPGDFTVKLTWAFFEDMTYYTLNGQAAPEKLIVYFSGGSFIDQPRTVHWQFLNALAEDTGAAVVVPIYPKLPAADASEAYAVLRDFCGEVLGDMDRGELIFMGASAGGGRALSLAMQLRDRGGDGPDRIVAICPWLDVTMENPHIPDYEKKDPALDSEMLRHLGQLWAGDLSPTDPMVSPLYGSFEGLGVITLVTAEGELLYPDIMRLNDALTAAGIGHSLITGGGMFHVWPLYAAYNIPESQKTYGQIVDVITGQ